MKALYFGAFFAVCVGLWPSSGVFAQTPPTDHQENSEHLVNEVCTGCHGLAPIHQTVNGRSGWEQTVKEMVVRGAQLTPDEIRGVVEFLTEAYGPGKEPMRTLVVPVTRGAVPASFSEASLPQGKGKRELQALCTVCHDLGRIVSPRRSAEEWRHYVEIMLSRLGAPPAGETVAIIADYLSRNCGRNERRQ